MSDVFLYGSMRTVARIEWKKDGEDRSICSEEMEAFLRMLSSIQSYGEAFRGIIKSLSLAQSCRHTHTH